MCETCYGAWCLTDQANQGTCCEEGSLSDWGLADPKTTSEFFALRNCWDGENESYLCPNCDAIGACCDPETGNCVQTVRKSACNPSLMDSKQPNNGKIWNENDDCDAIPACARGACCENGNCTPGVLQRDCGGDWFVRAECTADTCTVGACCDGNGGCTEELFGNCPKYNFFAGQTCEQAADECATGACCSKTTFGGGGAYCQDTIKAECPQDSLFKPGQTCQFYYCAVGACCHADGTCTYGFAENCPDAISGAFHEGKSCEEIECECGAGYRRIPPQTFLSPKASKDNPLP